VFLDACRDNPFAQKLARSMGATRSTSIGRGLAIVDAAAGSFVAYATDPHQVALDGDGNHSPFTAALLKHMETPGLSISDMMIEVRNDVLSATQNKQRPWDNSSLTKPFYFMPAAAVATLDTVEPSATGNSGSAQAVDKEVVFWQSIQNSNSPAQFQAYLDQYPNGTFAPLARTRIDELKANPTAETSRSGEQVIATVTPPENTVPAAEEVERSIGLNRQGRSRVQLALTLLGYKTGGTDGSFGPKSRKAISAWQTDQHETATGFLTPEQHAALLDTAAPKLAAWDAEQKQKAAEAKVRQEQQAAEAAKQQQYQQGTSYGTTGTTTQPSTQDAVAQAEAERLRLENERLKKEAEAQEDRDNAELGVNIFNSVLGGASFFK
jgi:caspase domain-containing protein/putative peptidoglycan binding protein